MQDGEEETDFSFVFPPSIPRDEVGKAAMSKDRSFDTEALRGKSVKAGEQAIKLVATSRSSDVVITDMHVTVIDSAPVQQGTLIDAQPQGAPDVQIGFDLASPRTEARTLDFNGRLGERYFRKQSEPLKPGRPVVFSISVFPGEFTYTWELEVDLSVDGRAQKQTVRGPSQQPFRVTGYGCRYSAIWTLGELASGGRGWVPETLSTWRSYHPSLRCKG